MNGLKRIIAHWTVGKYTANSIDKKHYHFVVEETGKIIDCVHKPESNIRPSKGNYAAHCLNCNTGSIGISMASMFGAKSQTNFGDYPFTERQFNAMCKKIAELCVEYNISVSPMTVLSHAEVEPTLGIKQRGKWDFTVIPFMPKVKGARACGDEMRKRVNAYLSGVDITANDGPDSEGIERIRWLQKLLSNKGYDLGVPDGVVGTKTEGAIIRFQTAQNLPLTGEFDTTTVAALRGTGMPVPQNNTPATTKVPTPVIAALVALISAIAGAFGGDAADIIQMLTGV